MPTLTDTSVPVLVSRSFMDRRLEADPSSDLDGDDRGHDEVHRHAERRPPARGGDEVRSVLPEVLGAVASQAKDEQPRRAGDGHGRDQDERERNCALDRDDLRAAVGNRETDVDRRDQRDLHRKDRRVWQPPEEHRRHCLEQTYQHAPQDRLAIHRVRQGMRLRARGAGRHGKTSKLNIIPLSWCSAMWQCAIQYPGLVTSNRMFTVCPVVIRTVSFQTRLSSSMPSRSSTRKRPAPCTWNGWCIGWSESISLTSSIFTQSPTRKLQLMPWFASPVRRTNSFQGLLPGVVLRLTSTMSSSHSMPSPAAWSWPPWSICSWPWSISWS